MSLNHTVTGSVTYTTVGTPTIVDGVASGFSNNDYLVVADVPLNTTEYQMQTEFTTESAVSSTNCVIIGCYDELYGAWGIVQKTNGYLNWVTGYLYDTDTQQHFYKEIPTGLTFVANTKYYVDYHYSFADKLFTMKLSTDKINWTTKTASFTLDSAIAGGSHKTIGIGKGQEGYFNGSVDLNKTFIKINGQPWFGLCPVEVKHINYGTSVGYTKVGNPTIVNGVASGFSASDYLKTNGNLDLANATSVEVYMRLKTPSAFVSSGFNMAFRTTNDVDEAWHIATYTDNGTTYFSAFGLDLYQYTNITTDTWYRIKVTKTGTAVTSELYDDSGTLLISRSATITTTTNNYVVFGGYYIDTAHSWGSIDFNETYIKVNDSMWFFRPCVNYLKRDDKLVFADSDLYLTGPVNYTIVGSPTIVDNVASNFSDNNYLQASSHIIFNNNSNVEFNVRFKTPSDLSNTTAQYLVCFSNSNGHYGVTYGNDGVFEIRLPQRDGGAYGYGISYQTSTWYSIKSVIQNNGCETFLYDDAGTQIGHIPFSQFLGSFSLDSVLTIGLDTLLDFSQSGVQGSVDLKETYIKVDGSLWFYGKNYATKNIAPVPSGYYFGDSQVACTAVGTPTIVDGVVSGFSSSNYLQTSSSIDVTKPFEMFLKIKTAASSGSLENITQLKGTNSVIAINATSRRPAFLMRYYGTDSLLHSSTASFQSGLADNTIYYLKCICDTNGTSISVSTDKTNWETLTKPLPDDFVSWHTPTAFILGSYTNNPFLGSIDLNETYVKVNNEMWFDGAKSAVGVGWFDMRTQTFTAAPSGATIGRDE